MATARKGRPQLAPRTVLYRVNAIDGLSPGTVQLRPHNANQMGCDSIRFLASDCGGLRVGDLLVLEVVKVSAAGPSADVA